MAKHEDNTVAGLFAKHSQAALAVEELSRAGFGREQVGVLTREGAPGEGTAMPAAAEAAPERGAAVGALAGGGLGGIIGAAAAFTVPVVGPVLAAGVLAGALAGASAGIVGGGLVGALIELGVEKEDATRFERAVSAGSTLVTVRAGDRYAEARDILARHGAYNEERVEAGADKG